MELTKIKDVDIQAMDRWFANLVDAVNYDVQQIMAAVIALDNVLSTVDTSPIDTLIASFKELVTNINANFGIINDKLGEMDSRLKTLGG